MALSTLLLVVASISIAFAALKNECPPRESTKCSCRFGSGAILSCYRVGSQKNLLDNLNALKGYSIKQLTLSGVNASTVPTDLFQGLHMKELVLDKFEVDDASFRPGKLHFSGLENSLDELEIRSSFKKDRPLLNLKLDHLKSLRIALFEENKIPEIGNDWFTNGPKKMITLIFEGNGIEKLGDKAFASLTNLRLLAVAGNHLNQITRSMLPSSAKDLQKLDFAFNKIRKLPNDIFSGMPSLTDVNIGNNLIHILPEDTWSSAISSLHNLYLHGNPLQCDKDLKWVCDQDVDIITANCAAPVDKKGLPLTKFCKP